MFWLLGSLGIDVLLSMIRRRGGNVEEDKVVRDVNRTRMRHV